MGSNFNLVPCFLNLNGIDHRSFCIDTYIIYSDDVFHYPVEKQIDKMGGGSRTYNYDCFYILFYKLREQNRMVGMCRGWWDDDNDYLHKK